MPTFKNLNSLFKHIVRQASESLKDDVFIAVREVEREHINSDVYAVYTPKVYKRRKDRGGLISRDNIIGQMLNSKTLSVTNKTLKDDGSPNLAYRVEKGIPGGGTAPWQNPRPFTENTIGELKISKKHIKALQKGLKKRGIKSKM